MALAALARSGQTSVAPMRPRAWSRREECCGDLILSEHLLSRIASRRNDHCHPSPLEPPGFEGRITGQARQRGRACFADLIQVKLQTAQIAAAKSEPMVMSALPQKADIAEHRCDVR